MDPMRTAKAWMNIFFNGYSNNPSDYSDLIFLNITNEDGLDEFLYSPDSAFYKFITTNVSKPLQFNYHDSCTRSRIGVCTAKELTYLQWTIQGVFRRPPSFLTPTNDSYVNIKGFSDLKYEPELSYYTAMAEIDPAPFTIDMAYALFKED